MRRGRWLFLIPCLADSISLLLAGALAYLLRTSSLFVVDPYLLNRTEYLKLGLLAVVLWHLLLLVRGGYSLRLHLFRIDELLMQFKTSMILFVLLMASTFLYHQYDYSRLILFLWWLFFVFLGSFGRQISHRLREAAFRRGWGRRRALFHGMGPKRELFETRVRENPSLGIELVAAQDGRSLEEEILTQDLDELFVFDDRIEYERVWAWREKAPNPLLTVHLVPSFANLYLRNFRGGFFDGAVMITLTSPASRGLELALKRLIDLAASGVFLLVLSPLFALLSLIVRLDSRGPVFFRQTRIGQNGQPFTILKFRSMYEHADAYAQTPTETTDPRITRVGRLLRSTGLDELPQLWNVFCGDMSLVGPRPEMPFIVETYSALERKRLKMRPGITGLWQVYARSSLLPIHSHIEYDLYYIENFSLFLDFMILLDTLPTMVLRTGV
ncbi:MAG TPA: sugar transferase [Candidatus Ozemobacteraceae bacterium]|nr:sugar transferase [Candidatus Ozemobacteraceae bacterium]